MKQNADNKFASILLFLDDRAPLWSSEELADLFRHQMRTPIAMDLEEVPDHSAVPTYTYVELFSHPNPPVELLLRLKDFAKAACATPAGSATAAAVSLPTEIASVLYYAVIVLALSRHNVRITSLDDAAICVGVEWALRQPWVDSAARALFEEAHRSLFHGA